MIAPRSERITAKSGARDLRETLRESFSDGYLAVALNLERVEFADAALFDAIADEVRLLTKHGGTLCVFNVRPALREFFYESALDHLIEIREDERDALDLFEDRPKRMRQPVGFARIIRKLWWIGFKSGILPDPRRPGQRRITSDRRLFPDRRALLRTVAA
jgi:anti-anti-sigma factor